MTLTANPECLVHDHPATRRELAVDEASLEQAARIFRALGDRPRLRLLARLAQGECCVTEVAEAEGEEISTISQRLKVLRNEGLVGRRRNGRHILYCLADQHVAELVGNAIAHARELGAGVPLRLRIQRKEPA